MTSLLDRLLSRYGLDDATRDIGYYEGMASGAAVAMSFSSGGNREKSLGQLISQSREAYQTNGVVYACILARMALFSEARFCFQSMVDKHLYGTTDLTILERPWPNGTTGELLARIEQDVSLAGNCYLWKAEDDLLVRLPPEQVTIVSMEDADALGRTYRRVIGYDWDPTPLPGTGEKSESARYLDVDEVAHVSPYPDPEANFRGMSWLTPVLREVEADITLTQYKTQFLNHAAAQPLDVQIVTPTGNVAMGEVQVGSWVMGPNGQPRRVLGVYPQGEKDVYRLTFGGGATTECCEDHVWTVRSTASRSKGYNQTSRNLTLRQIMDQGGARFPSGASRWTIPMTDPVEYDETGPLPLDPYLLGALLGNGNFGAAITIAIHSDDLVDWTHLLDDGVPDGIELAWRQRLGKSTEGHFRAGPRGVKHHPLRRTLDGLGLLGTTGPNKFIPSPYLTASVKDRIAILQGLIDTDGSTSGARGARFTSTSRELAEQVGALAESLGGNAHVARCGDRPDGRVRNPQWSVYIMDLPEWIVPCRLPRKVATWNPRPRRPERSLRSIDYVGRKVVQCIQVDAVDGLYLTDNFIVTHNTPNLLIKYATKLRPDTIDAIGERITAKYGGLDNAFRTLVLDQGADITTVGNTLEQMQYTSVQQAGEVRIAIASGVPTLVIGLSEAGRSAGLAYEQALHRFSDITMRPLWRTMCASLQKLVPNVADQGVRLWYDTRDIAALRASETERAQTMQVDAAALLTLVQAGFTRDSAVTAITTSDVSNLKADPNAPPPGGAQPAPPGGAAVPDSGQPGAPSQKPGPPNGNGKATTAKQNQPLPPTNVGKPSATEATQAIGAGNRSRPFWATWVE